MIRRTLDGLASLFTGKPRPNPRQAMQDRAREVDARTVELRRRRRAIRTGNLIEDTLFPSPPRPRQEKRP